MQPDNIQSTLFDHTREIAALWEKTKSAHRRINHVDQLTASVHELAKSNTVIAAEVKLLAEKFEKSIDNIQQAQKRQGERIGALEPTARSVAQCERTLADLSVKLDTLRMAPAENWKTLLRQVLAALAALALGLLTGTQLI